MCGHVVCLHGFDELADSAFDTFGGIFGDLGLQTKPSKAQPPAKER